MSTVKSYAVGQGDMFYIRHNSENFTIIDCDLNDENADTIIADLKKAMEGKEIVRFISTHPDEDHYGGLPLLDDAISILNFYVVKNQAVKDDETDSFKRYCKLRDGDHAYYIFQGCKRYWMNQSKEGRGSAGINVLWPDLENPYFQEALEACDGGEAYNNISPVVRYSIDEGASFLWLGDLETEFMENIADDIELPKTTVVFAAHHGRDSGKIPDSWLEQLEPKIIIIGEAPSRHLNYYSGYATVTQNQAGDITMECVDDKVHFYVSSDTYTSDDLADEGLKDSSKGRYIGSVTAD